MKRYLIFALVMLVLLLSGCSLTGGNGNSGQPAAAGETAGSTADDINTDRDSANLDKTVNTGAEGAGVKAASAGEAGVGDTSGSTVTAYASAGNIEAADSTTYTESDNTGAIKADTAGVASASTVRIPVTLYYRDAGGYLVPMTRWIDNQLGIARAAVSGLIDSAINREEIQYYGVYPVLPENTEVLGINIRDGVAVIDFNRKLLNYANEVAERDAVVSVVYTLTEFKTINKVRILINGFPQAVLKYGTDISGLLDRDNIMINSPDQPVGASAPKADYYCFLKANEGFTYVLPVSGTCGNQADPASLETLVRMLLSGKPAEPVTTEIPSGSGLIGCTVKNGVLTLNLDSRFIDYGGTAREDGILKQLLYTVRQAEGIGRVNILIDGNNVELPEGTDISSGLAVPKTINDVIDR